MPSSVRTERVRRQDTTTVPSFIAVIGGIFLRNLCTQLKPFGGSARIVTLLPRRGVSAERPPSVFLPVDRRGVRFVVSLLSLRLGVGVTPRVLLL